MIQSIMKIGEWAGGRDGATGSIMNFVENPNAKGNIQKVITILIEQHNGEYRFNTVEVEEFREKYLAKYLYRRGSSNGPDVTPTSKFAGDMAKTFRKKILQSVSKIKKEGEKLGLNADELKKIKQLHAILSMAETDVLERLERRAAEMEKGEGSIITLVFQENGTRRYLGDLPCFQKALRNKAREKYYKQYGKKALGHDQRCFVCQQERAEVYGFVNTYNFYTVDKPGFVSGGFKQKDAWKNYPVCFQCATSLELGKKYLHEHLRFNFYGFQYLLIPKFFNDKVMADALEALEDIFEHRAAEMIRAGFEEKYITRLTSAEEEIFDLIKEEKDNVSFDLLFFREKQSAFNILLHIEDILPSRFNKLFAVKAKLDAIDIFRKEISRKDGKRLLFFNFKVLRDFFSYVSKTRSYDKHFLELVGKIFSLKPIDYHFIIKAITRKLRSRFVKNEYTKIDCLAGYLLLNYLADLKVLSKGGILMEVQPIEELKAGFGSPETGISEKISLFFEAHSGFFDNAEKKACFLVGLLVQKLLNIQWHDKNVTPFRSKLQGLRLTESLVKRISTEAQNKLEEYKKNYYRELESIIAQYMVASGPKWHLTNDEISFYFTMGMNLADLFKTQKEDDDERSYK